MKRYMALAAVAAVVLVCASVWLGGLNQDEGWSLYAAGLVGEGKKLYRDFFYTQGPLMPAVYGFFSWAWTYGQGLAGARVLTAAIGFAAIAFFAALARLLAPGAGKRAAAVTAFILLGCNLYHVYYVSIPKTYALASLFVAAGYFLLCLSLEDRARRQRNLFLFMSGLSLSFAGAARVSLLALPATAFAGLLMLRRRSSFGWLLFAAGCLAGLAAAFGPYLADPAAREGLIAAQGYHASRAGGDVFFVVGSASRLVRWYLPVFVLAGMAIFSGTGRRTAQEDVSPRTVSLRLVTAGFLAVALLQMAAPHPYEDYQVPVMGLLAAAVAAASAEMKGATLLALGMTWACSFGSPLLEKWTTNGHDRFWSLKKSKSEMAQLREAAMIIEAIDPGGKELLTQDTYLAVETGRKVPDGLEMGPFSILDTAAWENLLENSTANVAALSGYTFAIEPPQCNERKMEEQLKFWGILKKRYALVASIDDFGQNATPLIILKKKE